MVSIYCIKYDRDFDIKVLQKMNQNLCSVEVVISNVEKVPMLTAIYELNDSQNDSVLFENQLMKKEINFDCGSSYDKRQDQFSASICNRISNSIKLPVRKIKK